MGTLSRDEWRKMGRPRFVNWLAKHDKVPGDWMTPRETAPLAPHEFQVYVNGQIVENPVAIYLDNTIATNTFEIVPPHVSALFPDGPSEYAWNPDGYIIRDGQFIRAQGWRPVDIFGEIELRRSPPPHVLRDQIDRVYVEEFGWSIAPDGRKLRPSGFRKQTMAEFMAQIGQG